MAESIPSTQSSPESASADLALDDAIAQAQAAAAARQEAAYQNLDAFMQAAAALPANELNVRKAPKPPTPIAVYPKADKWGAAALNGRSFGGHLQPRDSLELRRAQRAYQAVRKLGVVQATLDRDASGVYEIGSETSKSSFGAPESSDTRSQTLPPGLRYSIWKSERLHKSARNQKEKLEDSLEPHTPSVKNIYEQTGRNDLSGLSWEESVDGRVVTRSITRKNDDGRYVVETTNEHGEAIHILQSEEEFERYIRDKYSSLSKFTLSIPSS